MGGTRLERDEIRDLIVRYLVGHGATRVAFFGSFARGDDDDESDVDVLVDYGSEPWSLIELVRMERELSALIGGRAVDLVTEGGLSPYISEKVHASMVVAYP